jgi:hypothetical protein
VQDRNKIREEAQRIALLKAERWKEIVNSIAATPDGKEFFKNMVAFCKVFSLGDSKNPTSLIEDNGLKKFYIEAIRPYLFEDLRKDIE